MQHHAILYCCSNKYFIHTAIDFVVVVVVEYIVIDVVNVNDAAGNFMLYILLSHNEFEVGADCVHHNNNHLNQKQYNCFAKIDKT